MCCFWNGRDLYRAVSLGVWSFIRRTGQSISIENHHKSCKSRVHTLINLVRYYESSYACIWYLDFICGWRWNGHLNLWSTCVLNTRDILKSIFEQICLKWCLHICTKRSLRELRGQPSPLPQQKNILLITSKTVKNFWTVVKH